MAIEITRNAYVIVSFPGYGSQHTRFEALSPTLGLNSEAIKHKIVVAK